MPRSSSNKATAAVTTTSAAVATPAAVDRMQDKQSVYKQKEKPIVTGNRTNTTIIGVVMNVVSGSSLVFGRTLLCIYLLLPTIAAACYSCCRRRRVNHGGWLFVDILMSLTTHQNDTTYFYCTTRVLEYFVPCRSAAHNPSLNLFCSLLSLFPQDSSVGTSHLGRVSNVRRT